MNNLDDKIKAYFLTVWFDRDFINWVSSNYVASAN